MVPQKITLENFLSYRQRQEIDLTDFDLCMLAGPNGSGKSSVFDAVTFALFGEHRAGATGHDDLINKQTDFATVELEFLLDGRRYLAKRTIKRTKRGGATCTVQLCEWSNAKGDWNPIPETNARQGFEKWVHDHIGLTVKTFTSSTLLRQGEADRLIGAAPKERFEVLAGIIELERYQRLADLATTRRQRADATFETLDNQLAGVAPVTDEELQQAADQAAAAKQAVATVDQRVESLQLLVAQSRQWIELRSKLKDARGKREGYKRLLDAAEKIEADFQRLTDLRHVLPHLAGIDEQRRKISKSSESIGKLQAECESKKEAHAELLRQHGEAKAQCEQLQTLVQELEAKRQGENERLGVLKASLTVAEMYATQRKLLADAEAALRKLPRDPAKDLAAARAHCEQLDGLSHALKPLHRFMDHRRELIELSQRLPKLQEAKEAARAKVEALLANRQALQVQAAAAQEMTDKAHAAEAGAAAHLKVARDALAKLSGLPTDAAECPACGQALTPDHLAAERQRRQDEVEKRTAERGKAAEAHQSAKHALKTLQQSLADLEDQRQLLDRQCNSLSGELENAARAMRKETTDCKRVYRELPEHIQSQITAAGITDIDWCATKWPTDEQFEELGGRAAGLDDARKRVADAEAVVREWQQIEAGAGAARAALANEPAGAPQDVAELRARCDALAATVAALTAQHKARQTECKKAAGRTDDLSAAAAAVARQITETEQKLAVERAHLQNAHESTRQSLAQLTGTWAADAEAMSCDQLRAWRDEADALERGNARGSHDQLREARAAAGTIDQRIAEIEGELGTIPERARQEPPVLRQQLQQAKAEREQQDKARQAAEMSCSQLADRRQRRAAIKNDLLEADRRRTNLRTLADLLGRRGLQLFLIRDAERRIVECANSILDRISGGDLRLQLRGRSNGECNGDSAGGDGDEASSQAFELECVNRATAGAAPINVVFLSGSQRFRVAVSLALAIGQYANGRRSGECVVIDEGFGALDGDGQQIMIEELQRLKGIMQRIVLVSHQEAFANAFTQGYRFRIDDGQTRVMRLQN